MSYKDIIERLEKATGPDRGLDTAIAVDAEGFFEIPPKYDGGPIGYGFLNNEGVRIVPGHGGNMLVPRYTASIDASLTLVERMLPGKWTEILRQALSLIRTKKPEQKDMLPIYILLALFKALEAEEPSS